MPKREEHCATCYIQDSMTCPILSLRESKDDLKATLREVIQAEIQFGSWVDMCSFEEYTRGAGVERLTRPRRATHQAHPGL